MGLNSTKKTFDLYKDGHFVKNLDLCLYPKIFA